MADDSHGGDVDDGKVRIYEPSYEKGREPGSNDAYVTEEQFTVVWEPLGWKRRSDTAVRRLEKEG